MPSDVDECRRVSSSGHASSAAAHPISQVHR
jgi:hypothetical protein